MTQIRTPSQRPRTPYQRPRPSSRPAQPPQQASAPAPSPASSPALAKSRLEPRGPVRLTGRGAVVLLFSACFLSLLVAAWTGWSALADAFFILACGTVSYYTRPSGLRKLIVCPPLAFFAAAALAQLIAASGSFAAAEGIFVTLGTSAPWLFLGTGLTIAVALVRGYRPGRPSLGWMSELRRTARELRPGRSGRGGDLWTPRR